MRRTMMHTSSANGLAFLLGHGAAHASAVVSNLGDAISSSTTLYADPPTAAYAQEFETGNQAVQLTDVMALLGHSTGTYTVSAEILSDLGNSPGADIANLSTTQSISTTTTNSAFTPITFTPSGNVTLAADTAYWFMLGASTTAATTTDFRWDYTATTSPSFANYAQSKSGAAYTVINGSPFMMEVDGVAPVPLPASAWLALSGLLCLGVGLRRRRGHDETDALRQVAA